MTARFLVADVFDGLATLEDDSVDLVVTSPPFLALRSYLPADHPDKGKEIGSEASPAEFVDTMLRVTQELRRVLAPHGSVCIELGDTYSGSGGSGGDYNENGLREGQAQWSGSARKRSRLTGEDNPRPARTGRNGNDLGHASKDRWASSDHRPGWPLAKSKALIPELFRIALAYGINPLTGSESPAGKWRIRNVVTWARPNPPVGALGDKWRPATSDVVIACTSPKRYWDDLATRKPNPRSDEAWAGSTAHDFATGRNGGQSPQNAAGAPLLDYWEIPPTGYTGAHYAVYPPALVEPCVKAMCPPRVCATCGEPSRRLTETTGYERHGQSVENLDPWPWGGNETGRRGNRKSNDGGISAQIQTVGWSDCGHDNYRPSLILDPFAGSGTTLLVATGHGHDAIGIDLDERNAALALERVGPFLLDVNA